MSIVFGTAKCPWAVPSWKEEDLHRRTLCSIWVMIHGLSRQASQQSYLQTGGFTKRPFFVGYCSFLGSDTAPQYSRRKPQTRTQKVLPLRSTQRPCRDAMKNTLMPGLGFPESTWFLGSPLRVDFLSFLENSCQSHLLLFSSLLHKLEQNEGEQEQRGTNSETNFSSCQPVHCCRCHWPQRPRKGPQAS